MNKVAFKSTLEDGVGTSLYDLNFTYGITDEKISLDGNKAFVWVKITADNQILFDLIVLEKNSVQGWYILDSEAIGSPTGNTSLGFSKQSRDFNRVLLVLEGSASFYITSPDGKSVGFDPILNKQFNEIKDVTYANNQNVEAVKNKFQSMAITDLFGSWKLTVVGTGDGDYSLGTELVDNENHQTQIIKGVAEKGSTKTYLLKYPLEKGKPLEVTAIK